VPRTDLLLSPSLLPSAGTLREADPASSAHASAALELRTARPLLRVQRLADRAIGGGFVMMLAASAVLFGSFLLSSPYLHNVLGAGALETGYETRADA
jgi:hypothetical protein